MVKEITNKEFRTRLTNEGLGFVHLYKNGREGYHYIVVDDSVHTKRLKDTIIYLPHFNDQTIDGWIYDIRRLIEKSL